MLSPSERRAKKAFQVSLALAFAIAFAYDMREQTLFGTGLIHDTAYRAYYDFRQNQKTPGYLLDEYRPPAEATVLVRVDTGLAVRRPISPFIYGMNFAPPAYISDLKLTMSRWGGPAAQRYNWKSASGAANAGRGDGFANRALMPFAAPKSSSAPAFAADFFVTQSENAGIGATLLTVPCLGWVARDADSANRSIGVPLGGGPPLPLMDSSGPSWGYDPTRNRTRTSLMSVSRQEVALPEQVAQDTWISHLSQTFGPASGTGNHKPRWYSVGDDFDKWDSLHTDVHPAQMGYDDFVTLFVDYARAIKAADPTACVTGPAPSSLGGVVFSPLDKGADNFQTHADQTAHHGLPFVAWFLQQVKRRDEAAHTGRSLDVVDVHFSPDGPDLMGSVNNADTRARRLRATRALWDTEYMDDGLSEPIALLPTLRGWADRYYPGTAVGMGEWCMGGETDISGGLAVLDALGIFARENVVMANYGRVPPVNSPAYLAFKLMRNPDKNMGGFGNTFVPAQSDNDRRVASYAALDSRSGDTTLLLINKMPRTTVTVLARGVPLWGGQIKAWRLTSYDKWLTPATVDLTPGDALAARMPPLSALLIRLPRETAAATKGTRP